MRARSWIRFTILIGLAWGLGLLLPALLPAEVTRFEILERVPYAEGKTFGPTGAYERITSRVHYSLDPQHPQNRAVIDLQYAPTNSQGRVEFHGDLEILVPRDPKLGNGTLLFDVNNRGNRTAMGFFNQGDDFLLVHGFTVVSAGWDGELLPGGNRLRLHPPIARSGDKPITGLVRCEINPDSHGKKRLSATWANHGTYRPTAEGLKNATLTVRERAADKRQPVQSNEFQIHVSEVASDSPSQLPLVEVEYPAGFKAGWIYELIYEAQDPLVQGVCFTSVRDLLSALLHNTGKDNPLANQRLCCRYAIGFGISQSGRFLREFLYSGFNQDEQGRRVFDGLMPHVSGSGLGSFNHRFAQPTRHVNQHDHHEGIADRFPFSYAEMTDPLSHQTGSLLSRARDSHTVPKIMQTQSAGEYWTRSGSLTHTDPLGQKDVPLPDNVRLYVFGGTQHGPAGYLGGKGNGKLYSNHGDFRPYMRGLLWRMQLWVRDMESPPDSVYPTIASGTLVDWHQDSTSFPNIPHTGYPSVIQTPPWFDLGPRWLSEGIIDQQPPPILGSYRTLVPKCGPDGNELGCLSPPEVAVPLGTHTGWNLRTAQAGAENELVTLGGGYIPFAITKAERQSQSDPRPSLEETYGTLDAYLVRLKQHCEQRVKEGYLKPQDADKIVLLQKSRAQPLFEKIPARTGL